MSWSTGTLVAGIVMGFFVGAYIGFHLFKVSGEEFHFNMTKQLNDETRLLQICIETEIKIDNCNLLYGGVNTTYGEAIK
jgi:hypothetical protein